MLVELEVSCKIILVKSRVIPETVSEKKRISFEEFKLIVKPSNTGGIESGITSMAIFAEELNIGIIEFMFMSLMVLLVIEIYVLLLSIARSRKALMSFKSELFSCRVMISLLELCIAERSLT